MGRPLLDLEANNNQVFVLYIHNYIDWVIREINMTLFNFIPGSTQICKELSFIISTDCIKYLGFYVSINISEYYKS